MRDLVNRFSFLARKRFDNTMHWLFPNWWVPLYTSVTFSRMRYHLCIENKKWQDRVRQNLHFVLGSTDKNMFFSLVLFSLQGVRKLLWSTGTAVVATAVVVGFNFRSYLQKFI
jgi:hypothetical protein